MTTGMALFFNPQSLLVEFVFCLPKEKKGNRQHTNHDET
jgi:hypothetical protein